MVRAELKLFVLIVLLLIHRYKPHGYMLMKCIRELTRDVIKPGPGRIYPLLFLLKQRGLVREVRENRRKRYELTENGLNLLRKELPVLREILASLLKISDEELEKLLSILLILFVASAFKSITIVMSP